MAMTTSTNPATSRGEARRRAFLDAAREVFLAQGLAAASVNDVVRIAGGSLATLYQQFGSKEGLFLAMFEERIERMVQPLAEVSGSGLPLEEGLQKIGEMFLGGFTKPEAYSIYRIVIAEGRNYPEVAHRYMEMGPLRIRAIVRAYIEERKAAGEVRADLDADWAATFFAEMTRARYLFNAMTDPSYVVSEDEVHAHVARTVDMLVNGLRPR
jgi:AcrR family transcriptional regulator